MIHNFSRSTAAQDRLHELVPGGAHTYARGPDQYPDGMAPIIRSGHGSHVIDLDGNDFVEYGMGLRSVTLGHAHPAVTEAVRAAVADGTSFTRPSHWELAAAEDFLQRVPGAQMVKFTKNGSDATTAAVRLARAATGRHLVAACRSQPFFSTDDWFIGTTEMDTGIPTEIREATVGFDYNDLQSVHRVLEEHPGDIACLVLEPATALAEPEPGFLEGLREIADAEGIVLVYDEMITGMRWSAGGAQAVYGVTPDLSTWGKALGNGVAVSALAGKRELMELGGLNTDRPRVFLLSTTHGPEAIGLAAHLAVSRVYREEDVVGTLERRGTRLAAEVNEVSRELGLEDHVAVIGRPSCAVFTTKDHELRPSQAFRTLLMQELLRRGILGQSFVISAAHTEDDLDLTIEAMADALPVYARAIEQGGVEGLLEGRPVAPALRQFAEPRRFHGGGT